MAKRGSKEKGVPVCDVCKNRGEHAVKSGNVHRCMNCTRGSVSRATPAGNDDQADQDGKGAEGARPGGVATV